MTYTADISTHKAPNAVNASNGAAAAGAASKSGIGGGKGVGIDNMGQAANGSVDFVNLIMSQLQNNGVLPNSADVSSPSQPAEALKTQLQEIFSQLGQNQAPAEVAGHAELFQNGTANLSLGNKGTDQSGLMNNGLLAQQLGLDASDAGDAEIISALQDVFADLGIELNAAPNAAPQTNTAPPANISAQIVMPAQTNVPEQAMPMASTKQTDINIKNSGEPLSQETLEPQNPAQDISAHLENLTSPQDVAQNSSPAQPQKQDAPVTSPQTDNLAANSPLANQIGALNEAVTGEEFILSETFLSNTGVAQSFVSVEAAVDSANRSASAPVNPQAGTINQKQGKNSNQSFGAAPHQKAANSPSPLPGLAGTANDQAAQQPSATTQNLLGRGDGAAPTPDFLSGQDFLNGFNGQSQSFDNQLAQQMRPDGMQAQGKSAQQAAAFTAQAQRGGTPPGQQQILRAVTLNMTRGANNAIEQMNMQLEPAELGRVNVKLKMGDDGLLKAHIITDKAETLQAMQKDSTALHKALADAGLEMGQDSFTFDLRDQNDPQFANDKDGREALFDLSHIQDIDMNDLNSNDNMHAMYAQQYIRPSGVNVYV